MASHVVFEFDPATGKTVLSDLPEDILALAGGTNAKGLVPVDVGLAAASALAAHGDATRKLTEEGKKKVKQAIMKATSFEEMAEIEEILESGTMTEELAIRLKLSKEDFIQPEKKRLNQQLTAAGIRKVRRAIEQATEISELAELDKALKLCDVPKILEFIELDDEDLQGGLPQSDEEEEEAAEEAEGEEVPEEEEDDYDPFIEEPGDVPEAALPEGARKRRRRPRAEDPGMVHLQAAYDSDDEGKGKATGSRLRKRVKKAEPGPEEAVGGPEEAAAETAEPEVPPEPLQPLVWPMEWAWLVSRTCQHPEFRPPQLLAGARWAADPPPEEGEGATEEKPLAVALATSQVYAGDTTSGYDPQHVARVVVIDQNEKVLLDVNIRPRAPVLDYRTHLTGLTPEALSLEGGAIPFEEARDRLLDLLRPSSLLVGHRISNDLEALKLWHGPLVDTALLFPVETRKKFQVHSLRYLAERLLLVPSLDTLAEAEPLDALDCAHICMRLALYEAAQQEPTKPLEPKANSNVELLVRHIPRSWGESADDAVKTLCKGAILQLPVRWLLNESDPTDWRGETILVYRDTPSRDRAYEAIKSVTDVHVAWDDAPGAPPLGAFLTEQALVETFAAFGMVLCARIPRKATTNEPQSFAFVSFMEKEDAARAIGHHEVEVTITPTWIVKLRPKAVKHGTATDKRVAVKAIGEEAEDREYDWVQVTKR